MDPLFGQIHHPKYIFKRLRQCLLWGVVFCSFLFVEKLKAENQNVFDISMGNIFINQNGIFIKSSSTVKSQKNWTDIDSAQPILIKQSNSNCQNFLEINNIDLTVNGITLDPSIELSGNKGIEILNGAKLKLNLLPSNNKHSATITTSGSDNSSSAIHIGSNCSFIMDNDGTERGEIHLSTNASGNCAIGGNVGEDGDCNISILEGKINASSAPGGGAAIGGGAGKMKGLTKIEIKGGNITAKSYDGAAVGDGANTGENVNTDILITGNSTLSTTASDHSNATSGAGIGSTYSPNSQNASARSKALTIVIGDSAPEDTTSHPIVNSISDSNAGIGGASGHKSQITIQGNSIVTTTGGVNSAGIGGSQNSLAGEIIIKENSNVISKGGVIPINKPTSITSKASGIGSGSWDASNNLQSDPPSEKITILGHAKVKANGTIAIGSHAPLNSRYIKIADQSEVIAESESNGTNPAIGFSAISSNDANETVIEIIGGKILIKNKTTIGKYLIGTYDYSSNTKSKTDKIIIQNCNLIPLISPNQLSTNSDFATSPVINSLGTLVYPIKITPIENMDYSEPIILKGIKNQPNESYTFSARPMEMIVNAVPKSNYQELYKNTLAVIFLPGGNYEFDDCIPLIPKPNYDYNFTVSLENVTFPELKFNKLADLQDQKVKAYYNSVGNFSKFRSDYYMTEWFGDAFGGDQNINRHKFASIIAKFIREICPKFLSFPSPATALSFGIYDISNARDLDYRWPDKAYEFNDINAVQKIGAVGPNAILQKIDDGSQEGYHYSYNFAPFEYITKREALAALLVVAGIDKNGKFPGNENYNNQLLANSDDIIHALENVVGNPSYISQSLLKNVENIFSNSEIKVEEFAHPTTIIRADLAKIANIFLGWSDKKEPDDSLNFNENFGPYYKDVMIATGRVKK